MINKKIYYFDDRKTVIECANEIFLFVFDLFNKIIFDFKKIKNKNRFYYYKTLKKNS
jgi:hypothetical protein